MLTRILSRALLSLQHGLRSTEKRVAQTRINMILARNERTDRQRVRLHARAQVIREIQIARRDGARRKEMLLLLEERRKARMVRDTARDVSLTLAAIGALATLVALVAIQI